jgi:hypothetical protein
MSKTFILIIFGFLTVPHTQKMFIAAEEKEIHAQIKPLWRLEYFLLSLP